MVAAFAWFWLWHLDLPESTLVVIAGALIALPLALQESVDDAARERTIVVTKRSLILALWGLVVFVYLYYALRDELLRAGGGVCRPASGVGGVAGVGRPPRADRARAAPPPASAGSVRAHLLQGLNIWLCCVLLGGVVAAGGTHYARIWFSLNDAQFDVVIAAFAAGLVLLAALALVPRRRVYLATNVVVALLSGFLAVQLVHDLRPGHRCGRARLTTGRRVVRAERRPQRSAQRSLPEREQRRRLPAARGERANAHRRQ